MLMQIGLLYFIHKSHDTMGKLRKYIAYMGFMLDVLLDLTFTHAKSNVREL